MWGEGRYALRSLMPGVMSSTILTFCGPLVKQFSDRGDIGVLQPQKIRLDPLPLPLPLPQLLYRL